MISIKRKDHFLEKEFLDRGTGDCFVNLEEIQEPQTTAKELEYLINKLLLLIHQT